MTTAIPDEELTRVYDEAYEAWIDHNDASEHRFAHIEGLRALSAHFAKERDDLQAANDMAWAAVVAELYGTAEEILSRNSSGAADRLRAEGWAECLRAFAWALENGPSTAAVEYVMANNPFLTPKETDK